MIDPFSDVKSIKPLLSFRIYETNRFRFRNQREGCFASILNEPQPFFLRCKKIALIPFYGVFFPKVFKTSKLVESFELPMVAIKLNNRVHLVVCRLICPKKRRNLLGICGNNSVLENPVKTCFKTARAAKRPPTALKLHRLIACVVIVVFDDTQVSNNLMKRDFAFFITTDCHYFFMN